MRETRVTLPELALLAGTRASLGAGLGLLLADRLTADQRRAVGWTLLIFGALTTVPLAFEILGGNRVHPLAARMGQQRDESAARPNGLRHRQGAPMPT